METNAIFVKRSEDINVKFAKVGDLNVKNSHTSKKFSGARGDWRP